MSEIYGAAFIVSIVLFNLAELDYLKLEYHIARQLLAEEKAKHNFINQPEECDCE